MPLRAIYLTLHPPTPSTQLLVGSFLIVPDECCLENKLYLRRKLSPQSSIQTSRSGCWTLRGCVLTSWSLTSLLLLFRLTPWSRGKSWPSSSSSCSPPRPSLETFRPSTDRHSCSRWGTNSYRLLMTLIDLKAGQFKTECRQFVSRWCKDILRIAN